MARRATGCTYRKSEETRPVGQTSGPLELLWRTELGQPLPPQSRLSPPARRGRGPDSRLAGRGDGQPSSGALPAPLDCCIATSRNPGPTCMLGIDSMPYGMYLWPANCCTNCDLLVPWGYA